MKDTPVVWLLLILPLAAEANEPLDIGTQRQLLIDGHVVDQITGLKRTVHQPTDCDESPVIVPEFAWEHRRIPYGSVWFDAQKQKFRCWYLTLNIYDSRPGFRGYRPEHHIPIHEAAFVCYAESDDGIHWQKPKLGLHAFRGSKENNIVLTCPGTHFDSTSVMLVPADPQWPYRMMTFIGRWPYEEVLVKKQWGDPPPFGIARHGHYAFGSKDGIHWEELNHNQPVLRVSDRSMFWYDPVNQIYAGAAKRSHSGKRAQAYAWSPDMIHWTVTSDWIHRADQRDHPGDQAEAAYAFRAGSQWVGFAEMRRVRQGQDVIINWELLTSRDGRNWQRPLRELFMADGPQESWRHRVFKIFANPPIQRDGQLWIYYGGKTGAVPVDEGNEPFQALCLARLRRDGFVSLDATADGGVLLTKTLIASGDQLLLNVATRQGGRARVEVLDAHQEPIPGFGWKDCFAVKTDSIDQVVSWKSGAEIGQLAGKAIRLRIELTSAQLYSFQFR